jgi:hypothetical protein
MVWVDKARIQLTKVEESADPTHREIPNTLSGFEVCN